MSDKLKINILKKLGRITLKVNQSLPSKGITVIFGPSGSGKTSILKLLSGFMRPDSGIIQMNELWYDSKNKVNLPAYKRPIGYMFQDGRLFPHLNVLQNALNQKLDHILIVEDDITFLDSGLFKTQINKFFEKHNNNWDVILLAGNNMPPYTNMDDTCIQVSRCQTTTGYIVNGHYIKCLIKNIKTGLINLINKPSEHIKFAIDKFWFVLQREGKWFLIIPLTVIQREDYSDIEKKVTNFEKCMVVLDKTKLINDFNKSSNYNKSTNSLHRFILHP